MQDLNWNDLRHVLALVRAGRLAGAARQLKVNEATVARRLARLEQALGSRLFERIDGRLLATEMGQIVARQAEDIEAKVGLIGQTARSADTKAAGVVRLTAVPMLLNRMFVPALPRLLQAHPLLQIELVAEPRNLSLMQREADVALRSGRPESEQRLLARRVADLVYRVYGPSLAPSRPLPWIAYDGNFSLPHSRWIAQAAKDEVLAGPSIVVNDSDVIVHAIRAGLGRSLLPSCIGDREPGLARYGDAKPVLSRELWLLVHPEMRHLARITAVISWIEEVLAEFTREQA
jgi:DNA-binding transcriptional LysR family regulator